MSADKHTYAFGDGALTAQLSPNRDGSIDITLSGDQQLFAEFVELLELKLAREHNVTAKLSGNTVTLQHPSITKITTRGQRDKFVMLSAVQELLSTLARQMHSNDDFLSTLSEIPEMRNRKREIAMVGDAHAQLLGVRKAAQTEFEHDMAAVDRDATPLSEKQREVLLNAYVGRHISAQLSKGR